MENSAATAAIADELLEKLSGVSASVSPCLYDRAACERLAPLVARIRELKREKNATILAHTYTGSEIVAGVADYTGDSYMLSKRASETESDVIVFAAVRFMAETAKLLNPKKRVLLPATDGRCSLADSVTAEQVAELRKAHPDHVFVCYINTTAAVKARCDVCVTSGNVFKVVERIPSDRIFFLPDRLMGQNLRNELAKRGVKKEILTTDGACHVHESYDPELLDFLRLRNPGLKVLSHPECSEEIAARSDVVGSTEQMLRYIAGSCDDRFMLLTECGLAARVQCEYPGKTFVGSCQMCRYMKSNSLEGILRVLENPAPGDEVTVPADVAERALACIRKMFELAEG